MSGSSNDRFIVYITDPCSSSPCKHGSTCAVVESTYQCTCPDVTGWTGDDCNTCAPHWSDTCDSCAEETGWTGDDCNTCAPYWSDTCDSCLEGWSGSNCENCT